MNIYDSFDAMIDLETYGKAPGCGIQQIGLVFFNRDELIDIQPYDCHQWFIDRQSSTDLGLKEDSETLNWWKKQSVEAQEGFNRPGISITKALREFAELEEWQNVRCVWSHGASFDIPIIGWALREALIKAPWKYSSIRDTRTIFEISPPDDIENKLKHSALQDSITQVKEVQNSFKKLKEKLNV